MIILIQTLLIAFMLYKSFELKQLRLVYFAILLCTSFFCILNPFYISIVGIVSNQNLGFILLLATSIPLTLKREIHNSHLFNSLILFLTICCISFVNTMFKWPEFVESLKIFFYCGSLILIFFLTAKFSNAQYDEILKLYSILELFTVINGILFILTTFKINILYINAELFENVNAFSKSGVIRGSSGYPILNPLIFAVSYIRLRKEIRMKQLVIFVISILTLFFSYTRGETFAFIAIIFFIEIILFKYLKSKILLGIFGLLFLFSSLFTIVLPKQITAFSDRFSEIGKATSVDDVTTTAIRYAKFEERLQYVIKNNYVIGTGFINNFKVKVRLPFRYGPAYIDADQFYGNLLLVTGFLGMITFLMFIFYCLKSLRQKIMHSEFVPAIFGFVIYLLVSGFYTNNIMYFSVIYSIIISWGISFGIYSNRKEIYGSI